MKTDIDAIFKIKNIFKTTDDALRKKGFNEKFENFVNISESRN